MTAGHSAEQIPVAVETAEKTEHVEEVHKTAKSTESATEVREPLSADRPHSTQSAVHYSTQLEEKRRGMREPAASNVDSRTQDA